MTEHINNKINNIRINRFLRPAKYQSKYIYALSPKGKIIEDKKNIKTIKKD